MEKFQQVEEFNEEFIELDGRKYQFSSFRELMDSFRFDLNDKKVAIARFGGIIAVCRDISRTEFFELNDSLRDNICFYSNHGLFMGKCKFESNVKIVGFDFIFDELLVVVLENGQYFLLDPFEQEPNKNLERLIQLDFGRDFKEDLIVEAKIFRNAIAFQTKSNQFYYKTHLQSSKLEEFTNPRISGEIECWCVIPSEYAHLEEKFDLHVSNPNGGITCLGEDQQRTRVQYNGQEALSFDENVKVNLKNVRSIACNETGAWIAYLTHNIVNERQEWVVHVVSSDIDDECYRSISIDVLADLYEKEKERIFAQAQLTMGNTLSSSQKQLYCTSRIKINMYWVEKYCVLIQIRNTLILVGPKSFVVSDINKDMISDKLSSFTCVQEVDGVKLVSLNKIVLFRSTPQAYLGIFDSLSTTPSKEIDPTKDEDIRNNQKSLEEGVEGCIISGAYELNKSRQRHLLKAASFGNIFLQRLHTSEKETEDEIGEYAISQVCKLLRVAYQLNNQRYSRTLTYQQMKYIEEKYSEVLVNIMLRYNQHYIAMEVIKFLHIDKFKSHIYVHWARCKIEQNLTEKEICDAIRQKLQGEPNISFTDIAHKALCSGKPQIALSLLAYEPCIQKRIPVLLWMAKYLRDSNEKYLEKALNESLQSKDSSLIYLVIRAIWEQEGERSFDYFGKEEILSIHFEKFLRSDQQSQYKQLYNYLVKQKQSLKAGFFLLEQSHRIEGLSQQVKLMEEVRKEFLKDSNSGNFYSQMMDEHIKLLRLSDEGASYDVKMNSQMSQSNRITQLCASKQDRALQKLQSELKITDKRINFCKLKALIDSGKPSDVALIEQTVDQMNKKNIEIPYELITDQLLQKGLEEIAFNICLRIQDEDNFNSYIEKVIEQSIVNKKTILLNQMRNQAINPRLVEKIELALRSNSFK